METRRIGSLTVSVVGLGCNNFGMAIDAAGTTRVVQAALDAGITFFDTADIHGRLSFVTTDRRTCGGTQTACADGVVNERVERDRDGIEQAVYRLGLVE